MSHQSTRLRFWLPLVLAGTIAVHSISCGTIFYPERRGQPAGRLDPTVIIMDGLLLLFFFIPGVIAFAVDFGTGAIYLPPDYCGQTPPDFDRQTWKRVDVEPQDLTPERIEAVVREHTGRDVDLEPGTFRVREASGAEVVPVRRGAGL